MELVSRSLFASIFWWNYWQLELLGQGFRVEGIEKIIFSQKSLFGDSEVDFLCFLEAFGDRFSDFFCLGNRLGNSVFLKVTLGILDGTRK